MHKQVVSEIVNNGLCVGCGICAGVCPSKVLKMQWVDNGDLVSAINGECPSSCSICLRICPFSDNTPNEDQIAASHFSKYSGVMHDAVVGYYLASYVGYSTNAGHRERGASGGIATWLLEEMIGRGVIDAVICVGPSTKNDRLFSYQIFKDIEQVRQGAGSRYYPVDLSEVVSLINSKRNELRYAVTGLPCVIKGLRRAMRIMPRLRQRILYTVGLVCGHLPNRYYTEYLTCISGIQINNLKTAYYRIKSNATRAGNYGFVAIDKNGHRGRIIPFAKISSIWTDGYFQYNACNYCDDVFAEVADVTLMDAWLPEYERDPKGHSLIIIRHPTILKLFQESTCYLRSVTVNRIKESQAGLINNKRVLIKGRLYSAIQKGEKVPLKRVEPCKEIFYKNRKEIEAHLKIQKKSKLVWPKVSNQSYKRFQLHFIFVSLPIKKKVFKQRFKILINNPLLITKLFSKIKERF